MTRRAPMIDPDSNDTMAETLNACDDQPIPLDPLAMRTPCCKRLTREAKYMPHVNVVRRTCPKCRQRWQIVIVPMMARGGMRVDNLEWTCIRGALEAA